MKRLGPEGGWLEQDDVDALLDAFGIARPVSVTAATEEEAVSAAEEMGYPVVLKVVAPSALHKSDVGGVVLDLEDAGAVRDAYRQVTSAVEDAEGVLVQEMIVGGHEVLIGVTEDPNFGPLVGYGLGGIYVELLQDVAFRLQPLTDVDAREMVREIKGAKMLEGYRNLPPGDVEAVQEMLLRVSAMVGAIPEVDEMDLNPVKVFEPGHGAKVVDARIRVAPTPPQWSSELVDLPGVKRRIR